MKQKADKTKGRILIPPALFPIVLFRLRSGDCWVPHFPRFTSGRVCQTKRSPYQRGLGRRNAGDGKDDGNLYASNDIVSSDFVCPPPT